MEIYNDKIVKVTKDERNDWPVKALISENNVIGFESDIAIPTHYIECEIENKKYYGQRILILKERK